MQVTHLGERVPNRVDRDGLRLHAKRCAAAGNLRFELLALFIELVASLLKFCDR